MPEKSMKRLTQNCMDALSFGIGGLCDKNIKP